MLASHPLTATHPPTHHHPLHPPIRLERLSLGFCGRGFGDEAAALLAKRGPFPKLAALHLGGAYRLTDAGLQALLAAAPALQELSVPHASRVTAALVLALPQLAPQVKALDLTECRGIDAGGWQGHGMRCSSPVQLGGLVLPGVRVRATWLVDEALSPHMHMQTCMT